MRILPNVLARAGTRVPTGARRRAGARATAIALPVGSLLAFAAPAADEFTQHAAHEHGKATLDVALDGGRLDVRLSTPAINVLGFERAPRTDAERNAAAEAAALLARHKDLFAFPVAARCAADAPEVTAPEWAGAAKDAHRGEHDHDHDHDDHGKDHGGHDHADYVARWTFTCATPAALAFFDAPLVGRLQPGTTVQANVVTDALQTRQELTAGAVRIRLK